MTKASAVHNDASKQKYVNVLKREKYLLSRSLKLYEICFDSWDNSIQIKLNGVTKDWNPNKRINREEKS